MFPPVSTPIHRLRLDFSPLLVEVCVGRQSSLPLIFYLVLGFVSTNWVCSSVHLRVYIICLALLDARMYCVVTPVPPVLM